MELLKEFIELFLHLDTHLQVVIQEYGPWTYLILFLIIFCETGLVVTPILPGDSLLFAAGTFAASGALDVWGLCALLSVAAVAVWLGQPWIVSAGPGSGAAVDGIGAIGPLRPQRQPKEI